MADLTALNTELTTDPLTRGYVGMTDAQAATDINTFYRPAESSVAGMLQYCVENRSRTNVAADTTPLPLLGRLHLVADAVLDSDPFGTGVVANQVSREMKTWALTFCTILTAPVTNIDLTGTEVDTGFTALGPGQGVVWKDPDITALKALSENKQTRAQELNLGRVNEGDVKAARLL